MKSSRDNPLWLQMWKDDEIAFHQIRVNTQLKQFWSQLEHKKESCVFVPLCGKSLDMIWLAQQGHKVIGVELSPIAVEAFFKENKMQPTKTKVGKCTLWHHGNISILCGDFFSLQKTDLPPIDIVYDRAALTALPEDMRNHYTAQLRAITDRDTRTFLLTIEDAEEGDTSQETHGIDKEIAKLYTSYFNIHLLDVDTVFETDPALPEQAKKMVQYKAYLLAHKTEQNQTQ